MAGIAQAQFVSASSDMAISNLRFSSTDPRAELIWTDEWYGTVTAHAHDTDSGSADDFDELLGNDGFIDAQADTDHVYSEADYGVINGDFVAIDPSGAIGATTHSDLLLTEKHKQADGFAFADFDNFFAIFGGNPGDLVEVTFELDYVGQLTGIADELGFFEIDLGALLSIDDLAGNVVMDDFIFDTHAGTNTSFHQDYIGTLTVTAELMYEEEYWLFAAADSEVNGYTVPEPNILLLFASGLGFIGLRRSLANTL
ncbi:PEP-CTERM sorting domain-containing protein [Pseudomonadota bacterium]